MYHSEIKSFVNKLITFLGTAEVKRCLEKYDASLQSAGPFFREYYLKTRHPWWAGLSEYNNLEKKGMSVRKHLTEGLKRLGGDAKKIAILQKKMPEAVKNKYKKDLLDDDSAYAYLFELNMAWHFVLRGYDVIWPEIHTGRHSEFIVKAPDFEFEVECKRVKADSARRIRRRDFYRFAEKIVQKITARDYCGSTDIVLKERLHSNEQYVNELVNEVLRVIDAGNINGHFEFSFGRLTLDLARNDDFVVDLGEKFENLRKRRAPHALGGIFAKAKNGAPVNPIEITLSSLKADDYVKNLRNTISEAAKNQLSGKIPGLIICFLEGFDDLRGLEKGSALQDMCHSLFLKEGLSHVAAICYSSESNIVKRAGVDERHFNQALTFRNPNCKYEKAKAFPFFDKEDLKWLT